MTEQRLPAKVTESLGEDFTHDVTHEFTTWEQWDTDGCAFSSMLMDKYADGWICLEEPTVHKQENEYRFTVKLTRKPL